MKTKLPFEMYGMRIERFKQFYAVYDTTSGEIICILTYLKGAKSLCEFIHKKEVYSDNHRNASHDDHKNVSA